jgi:hypothetical protein
MMHIHTLIPRWRRYIVGTVLLMLVANAITILHPEWFVAPTGRIPLFGGILAVLVLGVGLWFRLRVFYLLTIVGLVAWAWVSVERYRHPTWGIPEAYLFLAVATFLALILLVAPRSVRSEFFFRTEAD